MQVLIVAITAKHCFAPNGMFSQSGTQLIRKQEGMVQRLAERG